MSGDGFPPELKLFAGAPSANALFDVGRQVALVASPSSLRGRKDGLCKEEEEDPGGLSVNVASDIIRDFGEK